MVTIIDDERMINFRFSPTVELPFAVRPTVHSRAPVQERTQLIDSPPKTKNGCERAAVALFIFLLALGVFFLLGTFFVIEEKEAALVSDLLNVFRLSGRNMHAAEVLPDAKQLHRPVRSLFKNTVYSCINCSARPHCSSRLAARV